LILAYVTLPYREEEFYDHDRPEAFPPVQALEQNANLLSSLFGIPRAMVIDAHFQHNQQWADLHIGFRRALPRGTSMFKVAEVLRGTFQEDDLFFRNVKHLGLRSSTPYKMGSYQKEGSKMQELILSCEHLVNVTLYQEKNERDIARFCREKVKAAILQAESAMTTVQTTKIAMNSMKTRGRAMTVARKMMEIRALGKHRRAARKTPKKSTSIDPSASTSWRRAVQFDG
jgi:hypothetical protein